MEKDYILCPNCGKCSHRAWKMVGPKRIRLRCDPCNHIFDHDKETPVSPHNALDLVLEPASEQASA